MKILFVAPLESPECTAWLIFKTMRNIGLDVECFSYREIAALESPEAMNFKLREKVIPMDWKDLVFIIKGEGIWPETLMAIHARKILWWFDFDSFELPRHLVSWSTNFHYVFLMCYPWVEKLRELGINAFFMPQATDPAVYHPVKSEAKYECDVAFIGSWKPGREEILKELKNNFDVKIYGNCWDNKLAAEKPVYLEEFNKVCSSARVILNITPSANWPIYTKTFSQRLYMSMSSGAFIATDKIPEINLNGLSFYSSLLELKKIIEWSYYYPDLRRLICIHAREEILKNHTYYHRIKEIFECLRLSPSVLRSTPV